MANEKTPRTTISKQDVEGVAGKLAKFAESLPEQERNVLGWILTRAQAATEAQTTDRDWGLTGPTQVSGPLSSQLARSAGLGPMTGTTTVSWGYKLIIPP
jgi:hypothetical protein